MQIFSAREKLQLDVYGLSAVLRNQIQTDDSFVLNRILSRVKESIQNLPSADESDDQALLDLQVYHFLLYASSLYTSRPHPLTDTCEGNPSVSINQKSSLQSAGYPAFHPFLLLEDQTFLPFMHWLCLLMSVWLPHIFLGSEIAFGFQERMRKDESKAASKPEDAASKDTPAEVAESSQSG